MGSKGPSAIGGVQGQSPWPYFLHPIALRYPWTAPRARPAVWLAAACLLALAACSSVTVNDHIAAADYSGDPKRIFVFTSLDRNFAENLADSFAAALVAELARCGATAAVFPVDTLQLDMERKRRAAIDSFKPDTLMSVRLAERRLAAGGRPISGTYSVGMLDRKQNREVWKATISVSVAEFAIRSGIGAAFAATLVGQMEAEGVLKTCPPRSGG
jgi:hypothetical protein